MFHSKKIVLCVVTLLFVMGTQAEAVKRYGIKSGHIKYQGNTGDEEFYWDNFGEQEARFRNQTIKMFGMNNTSNTIDIIDGQWAYSHEVGSNTATKIDHQKMMKAMMGGKSNKPMSFSEQSIKEWGGVKVGSDKVLGKKTDIYQFEMFADYKVWLYKGVPLKYEASSMNFKFSNEAVEFKENAKVDKRKFQLPPDIQIVDGMKDMPSADEMQAYRSQMEEMQNNPEYQGAMKQLQDMQNSPEYQDAMKQMQDLQNNPEYQDAMKQMQNMQNNSDYQDMMRQTQDPRKKSRPKIYQQMGDTNYDTDDVMDEVADEGMKKALGSGLKSIFNN